MRASILFLTALPLFTEAQSATEWQMEHPNGVLLSQETFSNLTASEADLLGPDVFVFTGGEKSVGTPTSHGSSDEESWLKDWMAFHEDVAIVRKSEYIHAPTEQIDIWIDHRALFLIGEVITAEDIANYSY